jgi:hypothetical protein
MSPEDLRIALGSGLLPFPVTACDTEGRLAKNLIVVMLNGWPGSRQRRCSPPAAPASSSRLRRLRSRRSYRLTAFEDFVTEQVLKGGRSVVGLYPATDPETLTEFEAWRQANERKLLAV